jgi:hypothetical protein
MKLDKTAQDSCLSSIPCEFRENYLFLRELITCKDRNDSARKGLQPLVHRPELRVRAQLNRRQLKILKDFLKDAKRDGLECLDPPVPAELEASIRIRKRATWLPWEAEAILKIDRWRKDLTSISQSLDRKAERVGELRPMRIARH